MLHLNKKTIIFAFVICLLLNVTNALACECSILPFEDAADSSTVIFTGKVVGYEYRKGVPNSIMDANAKLTGSKIDYETLIVKFQVQQWWKGNLTAEIFLITGSVKSVNGTMRSSCDYDFKENENYLIYASGKQNELRTTFCLRTQILSEAKEDLEMLGKGKKPLKNKTSN